MKKITAAALAALLIAVSLVSCSLSLVPLTYVSEDGTLVNKKLGLSYAAAPGCFEAAAFGDEYAAMKGSKMTLCSIPGLDASEWLVENAPNGAPTVFVSTALTIPTLAEFEPDRLYICYDNETILAINTIDDAALINKVADAFMTRPDADYPLAGSLIVRSLKFSSSRFPGLYYSITYAVFPEGIFLYDRSSGRCVDGSGLLEDYISVDN